MGSIRVMPICPRCRHFNRETWTCSAFPEEIPVEILYSEFDHREAFEGDNGIRFEPISSDDSKYVREFFRNGPFKLPEGLNA
jgi:hypothetical protein